MHSTANMLNNKHHHNYVQWQMVPHLRGEHIVRYVSVEPLYCTPETNRILYLNYK